MTPTLLNNFKYKLSKATRVYQQDIEEALTELLCSPTMNVIKELNYSNTLVYNPVISVLFDKDQMGSLLNDSKFYLSLHATEMTPTKPEHLHYLQLKWLDDSGLAVGPKATTVMVPALVTNNAVQRVSDLINAESRFLHYGNDKTSSNDNRLIDCVQILYTHCVGFKDVWRVVSFLRNDLPIAIPKLVSLSKNRDKLIVTWR